MTEQNKRDRLTRRVRLFTVTGLVLLAAVAAVAVLLDPEGFLARLLFLTHREIARPKMYGTFHLAFFGTTVLILGLIFAFHEKIPKNRLDDIVFAAGIFLFFSELYKQLYYHTVLGNGHYNFSILPLQLCSYVLYLYLLLPLLPEGRVKNTLYLFTAFYQTAGGCVVMGCPLFYPQLALSVHTMLWHIVMISVGVLILLLRGYGERYFGEILPAAAVFLSVYVFGMILNVALAPLTVHSAGPLNLFYLSPLEETHNIIIADVRRAIGWFPAVVTYAVLITAVCVNAIWAVGFAVRKIKATVSKRKGATHEQQERTE